MGKRLLGTLSRHISTIKAAFGFDDFSSEKEEKAVSAVKKDPIAADQFLHRLKQKKSDKQFNIEVRAIVRNQDEFPCTVSMTPDNVLLNVNQDVVTFDHSRVVLRDIPSEEDYTEYINASYVDYLYVYHYFCIFLKGPRQKTVASFWHLAWQENVHCIVMATGLFENANQQCDKYWGDVFSMQKYVRHGDIHIWLDSTVEMAQLTIRSFRIQREGVTEQRRVKHFEMVGFNDEATDPGFLLDCVRRVQQHMLTVPGPILIHCRCGGGKTAVFISVDYCLKQLETDGNVDVYSTVLHLRKFRKNMVRTLFQYRLIYDSVAMHIQCGTTVVPSVQLPALAQRLSLKDTKTRQLGFEKEYNTIRSVVPKLSIGDCAGGHRSENRSKSRDIMLLPPERARPYLLTAESSDNGTDFINAVFVDGYYQENNFLVTQWPMQHTVPDVWRLIYDYKITSLVVLNDSKFSRNYPCFWPRELDVEEKFGPIGVKYLGSHKVAQVTIRAFAVRKLPKTQYDSALRELGSEALNISCMPIGDLTNESTVIKIFQLNSWPGRDKGSFSSRSLIYLMGFVEEWQQKTNPLNPVCVMSKDGYSRVGVYCAANICCDQLKAEGEVDVFNAVRLIKKNRPDLVPNVSEYIYCYSFIVYVVELMQEDKPKIVITGPASKAGQVNRGYDLLNNLHSEEASELSAASDWSYVTTLDLSPSLDSTNLAARGRIATSVSPATQLQIPTTSEKMSVSSADSLCVPDRMADFQVDNFRRNASNRSSYGSSRSYEENNNIFENSRASVTTMFTSSSTMDYHTPANSPIRMLNTGSFQGGLSPRGKVDISKSRTRRPILKRQDAEEVVEMTKMDVDNQRSHSLSTVKKSNF
ncbi:hypothetical protein FSP39_009137 [Pinctada imbricata]|uniref:Uncharacterized protein n=1 Tax=Pinctada imbricata TaxID=66713 RepID=A0AA88XQV4_PINIB|nr:hypothetical protein FSP39_009137 [Pinctada imbricata]